MLISPGAQYRQELKIILDESEISALHAYLAKIEPDHPDAPEVAKCLRLELWYMLNEVKDFNAYQAQGGKP